MSKPAIPRACARCGCDYTPPNGASRYCPACKPIALAAASLARNMRYRAKKRLDPEAKRAAAAYQRAYRASRRSVHTVASASRRAPTYKPKPCQECGKIFQPTGPSAKWCDTCRPLIVKRQGREFYWKQVVDDPEFRARRSAAAGARPATAEQIERQREWQSAYRERKRSDPEWREHNRNYQREYKRTWHALLKLDPEAHRAWRAAFQERWRDYQREWAKQHRANMTADEKAALRQRMRERRRQDALMQMMRLVDAAKNEDTDGG